MRDLFYDNNMKGWGPELVKRRPEITMAMVDRFLTRMYRTNPDFVFTVTRDFVRTCQTPVLILPDDIPAHPYAVAMEAAMLAPKAEVSMFPWKEPKERIPGQDLELRMLAPRLRCRSRPRPLPCAWPRWRCIEDTKHADLLRARARPRDARSRMYVARGSSCRL